jgi:hypothetical protein
MASSAMRASVEMRMDPPRKENPAGRNARGVWISKPLQGR